jgi:3-hydroxymyristoyl/3-hydroxydecanoyl-(acyl carrier protein) dehydratase
MASPEEINIPQKPPMVMVDRLIESGDGTTVTAFRILEDNVFCEKGEFREPGLIENMAQTAAAGVGARPGIAGGDAPLGFIGGIRNLKITEFPKAGDEIITRLTVLHQVFDATIAQGEVFLEGRLIAGCELKIFLINSQENGK